MTEGSHWPDPIRPTDDTERAMTVLGRDVRSVGTARDWLHAFLDEQATPSDQARDAVLVMSELVTNALRHGLGEVVARSSVGDDESVYVSVTDSGDELPTLLPADPDRIGGLGLRIVDELAATWGVAPFPGGKTVWVTLPRQPR